MAFFNIGKKDKYGKQRRIEHRSKHLRISRTGGVALRKQVKAAGLTLTANSKHGVRVSTQVTPGTQVALQNGRFVLRGRYGRGPLRLNLSKSGVSVSTRNALGTFNLIKPNRSSVKIAGVQLRGKKAANIQMIFMFGMLITAALQASLVVLAFIFQGLGHTLTLLWCWLSSLPQRLNAALTRRRNKKIKANLERTAQLFHPPVSQRTASQLRAALLLVITGWGRGLTAQAAATRLTQHQQPSDINQNSEPVLDISFSELEEIAQRLEFVRTAHLEHAHADPYAITALFAQQLFECLPEQERIEAFLNTDDWIVALEPRTVLQEKLLEIFAEFAQLCFQMVEPQSVEPQATDQNVSETASTVDHLSAAHFMQSAPDSYGLINLNTASFEQLQTLPHIGFDRALDIIRLRPITHVSQLKVIKGIGPARLADIERAGVTL